MFLCPQTSSANILRIPGPNDRKEQNIWNL
uniref:Uncharacterized protein n=1 Tax=Anguilla anguilla TaxID=7936 RepID=A0A0E9SRV7_ANGAN